jgi:hypothetical protein
MDVNACVYCGNDPEEFESRAHAGRKERQCASSRTIAKTGQPMTRQGPYYILDTQEVKTTWHPVGI